MEREFNIVTNEYWKEHEKRTMVIPLVCTLTLQEDQHRVAEELYEKYKKTHDYNPLLAEYYDPEKERQYQEYII
jgi:hypothetical protein